MPSLLERDIAGSGTDTLTGSFVQYVGVHITAFGPQTRIPDIAESDRRLRAGWVTVGLTGLVVPASPSADYWFAPMWFDFENSILLPTFRYMGNNRSFYQQANRVRWSLSPGTLARINVFGSVAAP